MDKILKKILEEILAPLFAPILEQLTILNAKFVSVNPPAAVVVPATSNGPVVNTAPGPAGMPPPPTQRAPTPPVSVPVDAIPVQSREELGKALMAIATQGDAGIDLAVSILLPFQQPAEEGAAITLARVATADYPKLAAAIAAATVKTPVTAASLL